LDLIFFIGLMPNRCDLPKAHHDEIKGFYDKIERNSQVQIFTDIKTVLRDQRAYTTSLSDEMTPWSIQQLFNKLDPTNHTLRVAGSDHPITSKNQSRSNRGTQGCHIRSRDVMVNKDLHHGHNVNQRPI
jgi:hypothetical protein